MKYVLMIFLIAASLAGLGQTTSQISIEGTSLVISDISKEWQKDSLGKNGFRLKAFDRLRYSQVDAVSKESLFKALGKPHHTSKFYSGNTRKNYVGYRYYVLCENDYPKEKFYSGSYIEFVFDEAEISLLEITDGLYCG